jgi:hypothetical protein
VTGTLIKPAAPVWFRGPARRDGEWVVFDARRAVVYNPTNEPRVGVDLARVRTPEDAVAFVERYGPLWSLDTEKISLSKLGGLAISSDTKITGGPAERRERVADILAEARHLHDFIRDGRDAQRSAAGDLAARERVVREVQARLQQNDESLRRSASGDLIELDHVRQANERYRADALQRPETWLTEHDAWRLSIQIRESVRPHIQGDGAGRFRVLLVGETLLDFCLLSVVNALARETLDTCPECVRVFIVDDKRQKFCEPKCANRARFRAWQDRNQHRKGVRRGKA